MTENHIHLCAQFRQFEVKQKEGLQTDNQMFFRRKNIVLGELDFPVEVLTATLGIELGFMLLCKMGLVFMLMVVAMQAQFRRLAKTTRKVMLGRAIVELHVPTHGNEQHHKGHQHRADLQETFFHAAKLVIFSVSKSVNVPKAPLCPTTHAV